MTPGIRILNPISLGERRFNPLVRESMVSFEHGAAVTINPLALLFFEAGTMRLVPHDERTGPDILSNLS